MMRKIVCCVFAVLAAALCAPGVLAQDAADGEDRLCRNGLFTDGQTNFRLARVVGAKGSRRAYFRGDTNGCPEPGPQCLDRHYLVPGDEVVVSKSLGSWVCAWHQPRKGSEKVGWLYAPQLSFVEPDPSPAPEGWVGTWSYYENNLRITRGKRPGALAVEGDAIWRGLGDNVHVGAVGAEARPAGNELVLEEEECRVVLRLVGRLLVADDNMRCGGFNVSFGGVYRRAAGRPRRRVR